MKSCSNIKVVYAVILNVSLYDRNFKSYTTSSYVVLAFLIFRFSIKIPRCLSIVKNTIHGLCKKKKIKQNCVENGWRESKRLEGEKGGRFCDNVWWRWWTISEWHLEIPSIQVVKQRDWWWKLKSGCVLCVQFFAMSMIEFKTMFWQPYSWISYFSAGRRWGGGGVTEFTDTIYGVIKKKELSITWHRITTKYSGYKVQVDLFALHIYYTIIPTHATLFRWSSLTYFISKIK